MAKARKKLPGDLKLERKLGISKALPKPTYGPIGRERKPKVKPMVRPLLGIIK